MVMSSLNRLLIATDLAQWHLCLCNSPLSGCAFASVCYDVT